MVINGGTDVERFTDELIDLVESYAGVAGGLFAFEPVMTLAPV